MKKRIKIKKKIKKVLCFLLAAAALIAVSVSCERGESGESGESGSGTVGGETSAETGVDEPLLIPVKNFTVISPADADPAEQEAAAGVLSRLLGVKGCGGILPNGTDEREAGEYEILVGMTNRPESAEAYVGMRSADAVVKFYPAARRVVIAGGSGSAFIQALNAFIAAIVTDSDGTACIPDNVSAEIRGEYKYDSISLCGNDLSEYAVVISASANQDDRYAASMICSAAEKYAGVSIPTVRDNSVDKCKKTHYILVGHSKLVADSVKMSDSENPYSYVLGAEGENVIVGGENGMTVYAARILAGAIGENRCNLGQAALIISDIEKYSAPEELGAMPVALTDQLNACLTVVDVSPVLTGGDPVQTWKYKPDTNHGFNVSGYGNRIDEAKLAYSKVLGKYVVCITSSSGFVGVAEYPSGKCIWNVSLNGFGPHSIAYLPDGKVAVALSGNGNTEKSAIRIYDPSLGKTSSVFAEISLESAHGVVWDEARGFLWALGTKNIIACEVGTTNGKPTISKVGGYGVTKSMGGHDISVDPEHPDVLWIGGAKVFRFVRSTGTISEYTGDGISSAGVKSVGSFSDGTVIRTVAADVYASHDTNILDIFVRTADGYKYKSVVFPGKAFYKARIFLP